MQTRRFPELPGWLTTVGLAVLGLVVLAGAVLVLRPQGAPPAIAIAPQAPAASTAPANAGVRAVFFGDSLVAGANTGVGNPTFVDVASELLGWRSSSFGFPGSGFTTAGTFAGGRDYLARLQQLEGYDIEVLVIEGGLNDTAADAPTLRAKVEAVLASARTLVPEATLVLMGPWSATGTPPPATSSTNDTLRAVAEEQGVVYVDPIGEQWITGAYPGSGNADRYVSKDGFYPNALGHEYMGERVAEDLTRLLPPELLPRR